jgi:hypothetical protein
MTILSWLEQTGSPSPAYILLFVPKQYKRFIKRNGSTQESQSVSPAQSLAILLQQQFQNYNIQNKRSQTQKVVVVGPDHPFIQPKLYSKQHKELDTTWKISCSEPQSSVIIAVLDSLTDYGPATKHVGVLYASQQWFFTSIIASAIAENDCYLFDFPMPTHWVVSDDDVAYLPSTLQRYEQALRGVHGRGSLPPLPSPNTLPPNIPTKTRKNIFLKDIIFTHFSLDYRQILKYVDESFRRPLVHIQGVDTVLFPTSLLIEHHNRSQSMSANLNGEGSGLELPSLRLDLFVMGLQYFHRVCPSSFYQDDYVVSFLLNLGNCDVRSTWLQYDDNVARHIEAVSKSHHQMHMHPEVQQREHLTKECIQVYAERVKALLLQHV